MIKKFITNKLNFFLFLPKLFFPIRFLNTNNSKIRPYFGVNIFKTGGPYIRIRRLIKIFGNNFFNPNIIYAQSYWTSQELKDAINFSKKYNIPIIFNQNGWFYKGWYGNGWKNKNKQLINVHKKSKLVIYQSKFCKDTSIKLNSYFAKNNKIIHNCVPLKYRIFRNIKKNYFLLSGVFDQNSEHILNPALDAFINLSKDYDYKEYNLKLIIAGYFTKGAKYSRWYKKINEKIKILLLKDLIEIRGKYLNKNFEEEFKDINFALHLKYKDPCPNAVLERMSLGIIHIFSNSGGTPELIGNAGLGIPVKDEWSNQVSVNHIILVKKIFQAIKKKKILKKNVKKKIDDFSYKKYIKLHKAIFVNALKNDEK